MITNEAQPLRTTLKNIDWKGNPVNIDRAGTVPLIGTLRDIVPTEHLIGKASIPLGCVTTRMFTSIMIRPSVRIDRGMMLAASSEPTPLLFGTFFKEELGKPGASLQMAPN
jgi:hypothetical protein